MARVVDTDVFSFIVKKDTRGKLYEPHFKNQFLIVSFMTVAEVNFGVLRANWGANRKAELHKFLRRYYVQNSTNQICGLWAQVKNEGRSTGFNIDDADAWIAATAFYFNVPLITHNAEDFQNVGGLTIINER